MKVIATANSIAVRANPFDLAVVGGPPWPGALEVIFDPPWLCAAGTSDCWNIGLLEVRSAVSRAGQPTGESKERASLGGTVMLTRRTDNAGSGGFRAMCWSSVRRSA